MITNFEITENYALSFEGIHTDLHNNFDFVSYKYNVRDRNLKLSWVKSKGEWVNKNELPGVFINHESVSFLNITNQDDENKFIDAHCLSEITFFPSTLREINNSFTSQSKANVDDDVLYFFINGQFIRIKCERVILSVLRE